MVVQTLSSASSPSAPLEIEPKKLWQQACAQLQLQLSPAVFNTWIVSNPITDIVYKGDLGADVTITSPTAFHSTNLKKNLHIFIKSTLDKLMERDVSIIYKVGNPINSSDNMEARARSNQKDIYSESDGGFRPVYTSITNSANDVSEANKADEVDYPDAGSRHQSSPELVVRSGQGEATSADFIYNQASAPPDTQSHGEPPSYQEALVSSSPVASARLASSSEPSAFASSQAFDSPSLSSASRNPPSPTASPRAEDLFSNSTVRSMSQDRTEAIARKIGLRTDYTFNTFAVSTTNEMAHAAATAVSNRPGQAYNPLFLYGGVGVGKTHLMHAIGFNILINNPNTSIIYCTGEEFTNEIVHAIQTKRANAFKAKYRNASVLLIDDIQFIAGKNAVQEEFFHTFNALTKQLSQVVLTSDRPPYEINLLEDRLRSRFEAGLMIDIQQPSFELRTAILLVKAKSAKLQIPIELAKTIASRVESARKIEGIITSIRLAVELKKKEITPELIEEILSSEVAEKRPVIKASPQDVIKSVANHYHLKQAAIKGKRRVKSLVQARHIAMYILKEDLNLPLVEIGKWFSGRDHTTVLHAVNKIEDQILKDSAIQRDISALRMTLVVAK